ncbi:CMRF35-like molecule 2 isoform X1 [Tupaia chinensis]|uniref:CMRF35-like molecule 2 isoform X1 n=1 Tax=Tupaia chinensis TaxID=246437 RepID=UPI000FFBFDE2|nr:CMRF35-like molecule 2 isoform X1 [Tupaia chinensis]
MTLSRALLLLCLPGCLSLTGPGSVSGTVGGSLSVQCRYDAKYKGYNKYWCRGQHDTSCTHIVETGGEERERRNGPVSIRDQASSLTFTVTMEDLRADDAGHYWCRIQTIWIFDEWSRDPSVAVMVLVSPATTTVATTTTTTTTLPPVPPTSQSLGSEGLPILFLGSPGSLPSWPSSEGNKSLEFSGSCMLTMPWRSIHIVTLINSLFLFHC